MGHDDVNYREKYLEAIRLEELVCRIQYEDQTAHREMALVRLKSRIKILRAQMQEELTLKSHELFELYLRHGSMRVAVPQRLFVYHSPEPDQPSAVSILEGVPRITGDRVRDVWNIEWEANRLAQEVLLKP